MSVQGGTLGRRGTLHVPMWPVALLLVAAVATATVLAIPTSRTGEVQLPATAAGAWRAQADAYVESLEAAAVVPMTGAGIWQAQADAYVESLEAAAVVPMTAAGIWRAQADAYVDSLRSRAEAFAPPSHVVGLENPSAYGISQITEATYPSGLENPGAYGETTGPKAEPHRPAMVNGEICGQCR